MDDIEDIGAKRDVADTDPEGGNWEEEISEP
jgi:hypothetical protein